MNNHLQNSSDNYDFSYNEVHEDICNPIVESQKVDFPTTSEIYNAVFENSFHAVYIGNGNGHVLKFNKKLCKILGYSENEMMNLESSQIFNSKEADFINFLDQRKEKGIAKGEVTCIKKTGETFPCRISSVVYKSNEGENRSMNTLVDISEDLASRWDLVQ